MSEKLIANAIGFYCRKCEVEIGCTHAYIDKNTLYVQGQCSQCGELVRFSCDSLLAHLMGVTPHKGNNSVN